MTKVGEFIIIDETEYTQGGIWIGREGGEGMQVSGERLEEFKKLIEDFWDRTF